jgi:hypothetical protein
MHFVDYVFLWRLSLNTFTFVCFEMRDRLGQIYMIFSHFNQNFWTVNLNYTYILVNKFPDVNNRTKHKYIYIFWGSRPII